MPMVVPMVIQAVTRPKQRPRIYGGADSCRYTIEKFRSRPLPNPHSSLEK